MKRDAAAKHNVVAYRGVSAAAALGLIMALAGCTEPGEPVGSPGEPSQTNSSTSQDSGGGYADLELRVMDTFEQIGLERAGPYDHGWEGEAFILGHAAEHVSLAHVWRAETDTNLRPDPPDTAAVAPAEATGEFPDAAVIWGQCDGYDVYLWSGTDLESEGDLDLGWQVWDEFTAEFGC